MRERREPERVAEPETDPVTVRIRVKDELGHVWRERDEEKKATTHSLVISPLSKNWSTYTQRKKQKKALTATDEEKGTR